MSSRKNILFLTHRFPFPPDRGDRIRAHQIIKYLSRRANIHLVSPTDEAVPDDHLVAMSKLCESVTVVPIGSTEKWLGAAFSFSQGGAISAGVVRSANLRSQIAHLAKQISFDAIFVYCSAMYPYARPFVLQRIPIVTDLIDVDSEKWKVYASQSATPKKWLYAAEASRVARLEQEILKHCRAATVVTPPERELLQEGHAEAEKVVVPNGVDFQYFAPDLAAPSAATSPSLVFTGVMNYRPNVDAICHFVENVWPLLRQRIAGITLSIVGKSPTREVVRLADHQPDINVTGQVPDVRPYLRKATAAIVPLRIARGVQNKVLEAMSMSLPVVVSSEALQGIAARAGQDLLVANQTSEWIEQIVSLCECRERAQTIGRAAREFVVRHHDWNHCLSPFARLLELDSNSHESALRQHRCEEAIS